MPSVPACVERPSTSACIRRLASSSKVLLILHGFWYRLAENPQPRLSLSLHPVMMDGESEPRKRDEQGKTPCQTAILSLENGLWLEKALIYEVPHRLVVDVIGDLALQIIIQFLLIV